MQERHGFLEGSVVLAKCQLMQQGSLSLPTCVRTKPEAENPGKSTRHTRFFRKQFFRKSPQNLQETYFLVLLFVQPVFQTFRLLQASGAIKKRGSGHRNALTFGN